VFINLQYPQHIAEVIKPESTPFSAKVIEPLFWCVQTHHHLLLGKKKPERENLDIIIMLSSIQMSCHREWQCYGFYGICSFIQ